jgi:plastocyanin
MLVRRRTLAVLVSVVVLLTFTQLPASGQAFRIQARSDRTFSPVAPHVAIGRVVRWTASGTHTVTATSMNWSKNTRLSSGQTTRFRFRQAGTYRYRCTIHSTMVGGQCQGMCARVIVR